MENNNEPIDASEQPPEQKRIPRLLVKMLELISGTGDNSNKQTIPKPIYWRMVALICGSVGVTLVGAVVAFTLRDIFLLGVTIAIAFGLLGKWFLLRKHIKTVGFSAEEGVCINFVPKIFKRYICTTFINVETSTEWSVTLPKKVVFKEGHRYICYFEQDIKEAVREDLPTGGYLGCEDLGIYNEPNAVHE